MGTVLNFSAKMQDGFVCLSANGQPGTDEEEAIAKDKMLVEHKVSPWTESTTHGDNQCVCFVCYCHGNRAQFMLDLREEFIRDHDALLALSTHGPV